MGQSCEAHFSDDKPEAYAGLGLLPISQQGQVVGPLALLVSAKTDSHR